MKTKWIALATIFALSLPACRTKDMGYQEQSFALRQMNFTRSIEVKGEVKPFDNTTMTTPRRIWGTIETLVPEGKLVKKGEILVKINTREFRERISRYTERMELEQSALQRRQAQMPFDRLKITTKIKDKQFRFRQKKLDLKLKEQGPRADQELQARINVEIPQLKYEQFPLSEKQKLFKKGYLSQQELSQAELSYASLESSLEQAKISEYQLTPEYQSDDIQKERLEKERLGLDLKVSKIEGEARKSALKMKTRNSKAKIKRYTRRFKSFQKRINNASMTSPVDGVVVYPRIFGNSKPYVGMEVWGGFPLVDVANISQLKILARVNEFDISFVKEDQVVDVHSLSFPEKTFKGKVSKINKLAKYKEENKPVGLKYFDIEVTLDNTPAELKTHMSVELKIKTNRYPKAWTVPLEALIEEDKKSYLLLEQSGKPVRTEVTVLAKGQNFAVLKGSFDGPKKYYLPPSQG